MTKKFLLTPARAATLAVIILSLIAAGAQAQTNLFYDANGTTGGIGGTGNWTPTGTTWTTNPAGTSTTVSGGWTNGAAWSNNTANNAILQGTAGTVSLSSAGTVYANQIQVNTTGFTIQNSSTGTTSANRYFRTKNGIVLSNGVNLNVSSGVTTNGAITGFEGPIVGANGTNSVSTDSSITITGTTLNADSSVRVAFDGTSADVWVPVNIQTSGQGYAYLRNVGSTNSIYGNITVASNSILRAGANSTSSASRRINLRGNLSTANTDFVIGDGSDTGTVGLYGTNSFGRNVIVSSGALGYAATNVFGTSTVILSNGTRFGQVATIGTNGVAERTIPVNLSILGDVTFGLGTHGCYFAGNIDLNGGTRVVTLSNSTTISGAISNGGLAVTDTTGSTRTLTLSTNNTFTGPTVISNGGRLAISGSIASSASITAETGGGIGYANTNAFGTNTIVLKSGSTFGQIDSMGTNIADRTIANNISLQGDATFGFGNYGNYFGGAIDLNGGTRSINLSNSTVISGVISNGGLILVDASGSDRTLTLLATNTYGGPTVVSNGGRLAVSGSIASSASITAEAGGGIGYANTNAFGTNTIVLKSGSTFGQIDGMGTNIADRTIANNISLQGDATFGFGTYGNYFGGVIDLGGSTNRNIYLTNTTTISGVVSNGGLVVNDTIDGTNDRRLTLNIASASTFTGPTVLAGGTTNITVLTTNTNTVPPVVSTNTVPVAYGPIVVVSGSLASSNVTVQTNATLAGTGSVSNVTVQAGGELSPGDATAAPITVNGNLTLQPGSTADMRILSLADYDRVVSSTTTTLNGTVNVSFSTNFTPAAGTFQLFSGAVSGSPTLVVPPLTDTNLAWVTNAFATTGAISIASVTPPATGYSSWLTNYSTLTGSNAIGTADPDNDGFNNNLEYAFDGNPTVGTPALLTAAVSGSNFVVTFLASTNGAAVSYSVESTTDLSAGVWSNNSAATLAISNSSNQTDILLSPAYVRRQFSAPATNAAGKIFYRIKALITN